MYVGFPPKNVSPSLQLLGCLSVCHLDCSLVMSDVISVYLDKVLLQSSPRAGQCPGPLLSHCMTIHFPNPSALKTNNVRVFLDASRKGSWAAYAERQVTRVEAQNPHALQHVCLVSFYILIHRQEHLLWCTWIGILDFSLLHSLSVQHCRCSPWVNQQVEKCFICSSEGWRSYRTSWSHW